MFNLRHMLVGYNPGFFHNPNRGSFYKYASSLVEYICGVTVSRTRINWAKPKFVDLQQGDILEIGGVDNHYKQKYTKGRFVNLDILPSAAVDIVADAENMPEIQTNSFQAVICISVLEHTHNPQKIVDEIHRVLKPEGMALISTPWMFESHMDPHDFWRFSENQLDRMFENFTVVSKESCNGYLGLIAHFLQRNLVLRLLFGVVIVALAPLSSDRFKWATAINYVIQKPKQ